MLQAGRQKLRPGLRPRFFRVSILKNISKGFRGEMKGRYAPIGWIWDVIIVACEQL